jgi:predicted HTH domain antitoxin
METYNDMKTKNKVDVNKLYSRIDNLEELLDVAYQLIEKQKAIIIERDAEIAIHYAD